MNQITRKCFATKMFHKFCKTHGKTPGACSLKELRNFISRIILVRSLFYSIRVYTSLYFLPIFWKTSFSCVSVHSVFSACSEFDAIFINFCNICIIIIYIIGVRYSVFLFSFITSHLNNCENRYTS